MSPDPTVQGLPAGSLPGVTVWCTGSLLVHVTVLLTPITTVIVAGEYPGALAARPAPLGIDTAAPDWAPEAGNATVNPESRARTAAPATSDSLLVILVQSLDLSCIDFPLPSVVTPPFFISIV